MLFPQTQVSPRLVGIFNNSETLFPDLRLVIGWSIFVAAMTPNLGLQSELILRVYSSSFTGNYSNTSFSVNHSNTSFSANYSNTSWVFPVYYDSGNGTAIQGIAR
jgi:hypothetical protein